MISVGHVYFAYAKEVTTAIDDEVRIEVAAPGMVICRQMIRDLLS